MTTLFDILVNIPLLVMAEVAWCVRFVIALTCLVALFVLAIGVVGLAGRRAARLHLARAEHRHKPPLAPA